MSFPEAAVREPVVGNRGVAHRERGVSRMRIWTLANNTSAKRAHELYGLEPYEVVMEKILRR
jgi:hypothetical protein